MSNNVWGTEGNVVHVETYAPIGANKKLQNEITSLLHKIVRGETTLSRLGYLHMNTVTYVEDHLDVKLYFHPELALVEVPQPNGQVKYMINPALNIFKGYLFVGDLKSNVSYETVSVPKYKILVDKDAKTKSLEIRSTKKVIDDEEVLVLHCNVAMTMAAINGVDLTDPNFSVKYETIASPKKKADTTIPGLVEDEADQVGGIVISIAARKEFPVKLQVSYTDPMHDDTYVGYNPENAIPYLIAQAGERKQVRKAQRELSNKISDEAIKMNKRAMKKQNFGYLKFR